MKFISYLKKNGIKRVVQVIYEYKIELALERVINIFTKYQPLKNIIIIESHNDFDCNGGAFYDYLIKNKYNRKYKIVWLVRKRVKKKLPKNVEWVWLFKPSIKKAYYICTAKFFTADSDITNKVRKDQISIYFTHGAIALKNAKGYCDIPSSIDYMLFPKDDIHAPILASQCNMEYPNKKALHLGYPKYDVLCTPSNGELLKIVKTPNEFHKVILWMPTFRKSIAFKRNDSKLEQKLGIPLIETQDQYHSLNSYLANKNVLLVIKLHPKQDVSKLKLKNLSNIIVLTGDMVKDLDVDNYRLMKDADGLISDYSSSLYDYLILNRPVGFVFSDLKEYKLGLSVNNLSDYLVGTVIKEYAQLLEFIDDIVMGRDTFKDKRERLAKRLFDYVDDKNCERIAKYFHL